MPSIHMTDLTLRRLVPPESGQVTYYDQSLKGFGLRLSQGGSRTWVLVHGPKRKRERIGTYPTISLAQARSKAKDKLATYQLDGDQPVITTGFDDALERFMSGYAEKNKPSTVKETERLLNRHLKPVGSGKTLPEITKAALVEVIDSINAKSERRHFYTAAHTFFQWCRRYDVPNPLMGVEKPAKSPARTRLLSDHEFVKVWRASLQCGDYGLLVRVLLVSGQRLAQIAHMQGTYIDHHKRTIHWPPELVKGNKPFLFPYSDLLHSLLPQGAGLLFTTEDGAPWNSWTDPHKELMKSAGIPHFTRHDCRRFYSTTHSAIGTQPHIRELLLSHAFGSEVSRTYDLYTYLPEKRAAQERYEEHLAALLAQ